MPRRGRYGALPDGTVVDVITLGYPESLELNVLTYGCIITSLAVPDGAGAGVVANVVLGFDRLEPYVDASPYFGAVVGRYANRIANARFAIDGREHRVSPNEPPNHLHGGFRGFDKRVWDAEVSGNGTAVVFRRKSPDGEEGYPGEVDAQVTYTIADRELRIVYEAVTDAPTHVNLTQHSYFNLRGDRRRAGPLPRHQREHVSAGRGEDDSNRRACACRKLAVRFSGINGDWIAPSRRSRATEARQVDTITTSTSIGRARRWRSRRACSSRRAGGRSRCAPRNPDCSSIRARSSTIAAFASSRSIIPIRRTAGISLDATAAGRAISVDDGICIRLVAVATG